MFALQEDHREQVCCMRLVPVYHRLGRHSLERASCMTDTVQNMQTSLRHIEAGLVELEH